MSGYIHEEILLFLQSAALGAGLLLCYDLLKALRRVIPHTGGATAIEDVIYWVCAGIVVFSAAYRLNHGSLRSFLLLGLVLGAWACHVTLSPVFLWIWTRILEVPVFFVKISIKRLLFLLKRGKILMNRIVTPTLRSRAALGMGRGKQVGKVKKTKQKKNSE